MHRPSGIAINKEAFQRARVSELSGRWLRPKAWEPVLRRMEKDFQLQTEGYSFQERPIYSLQWGSGSKTVLIWAQMHGNESTGSRAVADVMQSIIQAGKKDPQIEQWFHQIRLVVIPQLNPDGAERYTRRNAQQIDINRDAVARQSPEMRVFRKILDRERPSWCFNLHDQRSLFSLGEDKLPATLSFLAAASGPEKPDSAARKRAQHLLGEVLPQLPETWRPYWGRYTEEFYPTALGDNLHREGYSTVLVEAGAAAEDPHREVARQQCWAFLLHALGWIAGGDDNTLSDTSLKVYNSLYINKKERRDLIIRSCVISNPDGTQSQLDLGFTQEEMAHLPSGQLHRRWILSDLGDLRNLVGFMEREGGKLESLENMVLDRPANCLILGETEKHTFKQGLWNP